MEILNEVHRLIEKNDQKFILIGYRLPVFNKRAKRRLLAHPKFYFFDTGIYRTLRPMGPLDMPEMAEGISFESLFFQDLLAINDSLNLGYKLSHLRRQKKNERRQY